MQQTPTSPCTILPAATPQHLSGRGRRRRILRFLRLPLLARGADIEQLPTEGGGRLCFKRVRPLHRSRFVCCRTLPLRRPLDCTGGPLPGAMASACRWSCCPRSGAPGPAAHAGDDVCGGRSPPFSSAVPLVGQPGVASPHDLGAGAPSAGEALSPALPPVATSLPSCGRKFHQGRA